VRQSVALDGPQGTSTGTTRKTAMIGWEAAKNEIAR